MCVTDDEEELVDMQQRAKKRIDVIYILNRQRLKEKPSLIEAAQGLTKAAGIDFNSLSCYILVIIGWEWQAYF